MKISQLEEVIRAKVRKIKTLKEMNALVTSKVGTKSVSYKDPAELASLRSDTNVSSIVNTGGMKIKETEVTQPTSYQKGDKVIWTGETKPLDNGETISKGQHGVVTGANGIFVGVDWEGSVYTHVMNSNNLVKI